MHKTSVKYYYHFAIMAEYSSTKEEQISFEN